MFYDDQERRDMEDDLHMRVDCINIRGSKACKGTRQLNLCCLDFLDDSLSLVFILCSCVPPLDLNPPEGKGCDSLLQIVCRDGRVISLCADSSDDAL